MIKTKRHVNFPSIEQFRTLVSNINRHYNYVGLDDNGDAIYDHSKPKPIVSVSGTCKIHGSNMGVSWSKNDGIWFQSREHIITSKSDNAGCAFAGEVNQETWLKLIKQVIVENNVDEDNNIISIFAEWAGKGIQKGVGVSNLDKSCFIFAAKVSPIVDSDDLEAVKANPAYWVDETNLRAPEAKIYNINDYETFSVEIDFNMPELVQNKLAEITARVEAECPVAKAFGFPNTIGEGVVYRVDLNGQRYIMKIKGEKHSSSKVKTLASVDVEKLNSISEFVTYAVTESRFNQGLENVFPNNEPFDVRKMGDLIKWVVSDIIKEESDTLSSNGLEPKEVNPYISRRVRDLFFNMKIN